MLHLQRRVELQLRVEAVHAVGLGGERHVVPGRQLLEVDPGDPGVAEAAVGIAGGLQLLGGVEHLGPGLGRVVGVEAGFLERVLVVPHHRTGRVERKRQHLALGGGVIAGDARQVGLGIEGLAGFLHQHVHRLHRAGGRHHGGGADLEHLHDVRRLSRAERGDAGVHGIRVAALVGRDDLVVLLGRIEVGGELDDQIVVGAGHSVPPLDLRLRRGIAGRKQHGAGSEPAQADRISHRVPPRRPLRRLTDASCSFPMTTACQPDSATAGKVAQQGGCMEGRTSRVGDLLPRGQPVAYCRAKTGPSGGQTPRADVPFLMPPQRRGV